jgi:hypothetical protein
MTRTKVALALLALTASGLATACTVQAPASRAIAGELPTYGSERYYEAPTSIAASIRRTTATHP